MYSIFHRLNQKPSIYIPWIFRHNRLAEPLLKLNKIAQKLIVRVLLAGANLWSLCCTRKWKKFSTFLLWTSCESSSFSSRVPDSLEQQQTNKTKTQKMKKSIKTKLDMRKKRKNSPSDFFFLYSMKTRLRIIIILAPLKTWMSGSMRERLWKIKFFWGWKVVGLLCVRLQLWMVLLSSDPTTTDDIAARN